MKYVHYPYLAKDKVRGQRRVQRTLHVWMTRMMDLDTIRSYLPGCCAAIHGRLVNLNQNTRQYTSFIDFYPTKVAHTLTGIADDQHYSPLPRDYFAQTDS